MPPLRRIAPALAACLVLPACGALPLGGEPEPAPSATKRQLALMVLPRDALGPEADGLRQSRFSGPTDNAAEAETTLDPEDDGQALREAGRRFGYDLSYAPPDAVREGVLEVGTSVELFETELEASRYLHDQADDYEYLRGQKVGPGVKLVASERLDPGDVGDEGRAFTATVRAGKHRLYGTIVAFRNGRIVGAAVLARFDDAGVAGRTQELAVALDARIRGVLDGTVTGRPEPIVRTSGDPRPLTLAAADFPTLELRLAYEGRVTPTRARVFLREFNVIGGTLGSTRPVYVRTLAQTFRNEAPAREHDRLLASRAGARRLIRAFLQAGLRGRRPEITALRAEPAAWPGADTAGIRFSFSAPRGELRGVYLSVTRGRRATSVLLVGHADAVRDEDVLLMLDALRERLELAE